VILGTYPGWTMETENRFDHLFYRLTRTGPAPAEGS
jgi:hypothetical protein